MPGTLYVVATPIGNLEDMTFRAVRVLREVQLIAAEDTRHTAVLLRHYQIKTPTTSLHEHNERRAIPPIVARLVSGESIAIVSDAGTPSVSDPGYRLVRAALDAGVRVEAVPGASAVLTALVASGLPTDSFVFLGFAPSRSNARNKWLERLSQETHTAIFFESPRRVRDTLTEMAAYFGNRPIVVARELTKLHETLVVGPISTLLERLPASLKGEVTILVGPSEPALLMDSTPNDLQLRTEFGQITDSGVSSRREAVRQIAARHHLTSKQVYNALLRAQT